MKGLAAETHVFNTATKPWLDRDSPGNHFWAAFGKAHSESTQKSSWVRGQSPTEQVSKDPGSCYNFCMSIWTWASHENVNKPSMDRSTTKLSYLMLAVKCKGTCWRSPTYPSSDKTARACTDPTQAWISVAPHVASETRTFSGNTCRPKSRAETPENKHVSGRLTGGDALCSVTVYTQLQQQVIPASYPTRTRTRRKEGRTTSEDWFIWAFSVLQCCSGWFWPAVVSWKWQITALSHFV